MPPLSKKGKRSNLPLGKSFIHHKFAFPPTFSNNYVFLLKKPSFKNCYDVASFFASTLYVKSFIKYCPSHSFCKIADFIFSIVSKVMEVQGSLNKLWIRHVVI